MVKIPVGVVKIPGMRGNCPRCDSRKVGTYVLQTDKHFLPMIGMPVTQSSVSDFYGTGDSSVVITNVSCSEGEDNIRDCQHFVTNLDHEDAGCNEVAVVCQGSLSDVVC